MYSFVTDGIQTGMVASVVAAWEGIYVPPLTTSLNITAMTQTDVVADVG